MWTIYQTENTEYIPNGYINQKDFVITDLKSRLFDLEQDERDNNILYQKLNQLKRNYTILNDDKNKLELVIDEKDREYNKNINDLCNKNEDLRINYNDKLALNKKLFKENDELEKEIEAKDDEINKLKKKLKKLKNQLNNNLDEQEDLDDQVKKLKAATNSQANEIKRLNDDNKNLNDIANDQKRRLNNIQNEIDCFKKRSQENDMDIQNLNDNLRDIIHYTNSIQYELDKNNSDNKLLWEGIKDRERQCLNFNNDNAFLNDNILKERNLRCDKERQNDCLNVNIYKSDKCINNLNDKFNIVTSLFNKATNESKCFQANNNHLKDHITLSTQQNQQLLGELENVKEQDYILKNIMETNNNESCRLLSKVQNTIEQENIYINNYESYPLNSYNNRGYSPSRCLICGNKSPKSSYQKRE